MVAVNHVTYICFTHESSAVQVRSERCFLKKNDRSDLVAPPPAFGSSALPCFIYLKVCTCRMWRGSKSSPRKKGWTSLP